jgi:hypothetical protein
VNRDEQEMALWREAYNASRLITRAGVEAEADAAVEAFRRRYPPQPQAPEAVWHDEPPFPKDGIERPCWIMSHGKPFPLAGEVYWCDCEWRMCVVGDGSWHRLAGRRVCPIAKPPEPTP